MHERQIEKFNEIMINSELVEISEDEPKCWLRAKLGSKWSERDLSILSEVLFKEYQSMNALNKHLRTDREFLAKMLTRSKNFKRHISRRLIENNY